MWLIGAYEAVTLFSLKLSSATAAGGKTLLVPTPFALKMALLDAACRTRGVAEAERLWPALRDLAVAVRPAERVVVSNLFQKVLRPRRRPAAAGDPDAGPFQKTIGYREYAHLVGPLGIAVSPAGGNLPPGLEDLLLNVNYLGKRGGFMQLLQPPWHTAELPAGYVEVTREQASFSLHGTLQVLDDCGPELSFARASIYSREKVRPGRDRVARHVVLPYRLTQSSKAYSLYERSEG